MNEKRDVDAPYTVCRHRNDLIFVPDRDAGNINQWLFLEIVVKQKAEDDAHAKNDQ